MFFKLISSRPVVRVAVENIEGAYSFKNKQLCRSINRLAAYLQSEGAVSNSDVTKKWLLFYGALDKVLTRQTAEDPIQYNRHDADHSFQTSKLMMEAYDAVKPNMGVHSWFDVPGDSEKLFEWILELVGIVHDIGYPELYLSTIKRPGGDIKMSKCMHAPLGADIFESKLKKPLLQLLNALNLTEQLSNKIVSEIQKSIANHCSDKCEDHDFDGKLGFNFGDLYVHSHNTRVQMSGDKSQVSIEAALGQILFNVSHTECQALSSDSACRVADISIGGQTLSVGLPYQATGFNVGGPFL